jgi:hypothetical protein
MRQRPQLADMRPMALPEAAIRLLHKPVLVMRPDLGFLRGTLQLRSAPGLGLEIFGVRHARAVLWAPVASVVNSTRSKIA